MLLPRVLQEQVQPVVAAQREPQWVGAWVQAAVVSAGRSSQPVPVGKRQRHGSDVRSTCRRHCRLVRRAAMAADVGVGVEWYGMRQGGG